MKSLRSAFASILSFALVATAPGIAPYHAAAQSVNTRVSVNMGANSAVPGIALTAPVTGTNGAAMLATPNLNGTLNAIGLPTPVTLLPAASNGGAAAASSAAGANAAASALVLQVAAPSAASRPLVSQAAGARAFSAPAPAKSEGLVTTLERVQQPLPEFGKMNEGSAAHTAGADFLSRTGSFKGASSEGSVVPVAGAMGALNAGRLASDSKNGLRKSRKGMPSDKPEGGAFMEPDTRSNSEDVSGLDELGNPRRVQSDGPDSVSDGMGGRDGSSGFLGGFVGLLSQTVIANVVMAGMTAALGAGQLVMIPLYLGLIVPALILHEMGHAKMADMLGDPSARLAGRMSFKPRNLLTHIDPIMTIVVPLLTMMFAGFIFGGARPVMVNWQNFRSPVKDMAKVAIAGPGVNFALALLLGLAHTAAIAIGLSGVVPTLLALAVFFNVMLGVFNLIPFAPLDGHHIVRWLLADVFKNPGLANKLDANRGIQMFGVLIVILFFGAPLLFVIKTLTGIFLAGSAVAGGMQLASAALPAIAALGLMIGQVLNAPKGNPELKPGEKAPVEAKAAAKAEPAPVDVIVELTGSKQPLALDAHLSLVNAPWRRVPSHVDAYTLLARGMTLDLEAAGLGQDVLRTFDAAPIATYRRINAATLRLPSDKVEGFKAAMAARGFKVHDNARREIIKPVPTDPKHPESPSPENRGAVTMPETLGISNADKVMEIAKGRFGQPEIGLGLFGRLTVRILRVLGADVPQPPVAVIDSGADISHKQLKRIKEVKNMTRGENIDDIGHGSWVHSMVLWFAPWLKNSTHYKTFENGGATLDDILKSLTEAGNDGNIIMSNSWGSDGGDPDSPDAKLVKKLAEEGRVMVFAAGNSGSRKNTVGDPAIMVHRDAKTGAPRILAVAATDRAKKTVYFSSRGKGSRVTASDSKYKDWPQRPDLAEQGYNTEAAWPMNLRADRTDPALGPVKAISGTSMSTPKVAGGIALLAMLFGATEVGEKLDAVVNAVMSTLVKPTNGDGKDDQGEGFMDLYAAYQALEKQYAPVMPRRIANWLAAGGTFSALVGLSSRTTARLTVVGTLGAAVIGGVIAAVTVGLGAGLGVLAIVGGLVGLAAALRLAFGTIGTAQDHPWYRDAVAAVFGVLGAGAFSAGVTSLVLALVSLLG